MYRHGGGGARMDSHGGGVARMEGLSWKWGVRGLIGWEHWKGRPLKHIMKASTVEASSNAFICGTLSPNAAFSA
jgi:hypothetical protein